MAPQGSKQVSCGEDPRGTCFLLQAGAGGEDIGVEPILEPRALQPRNPGAEGARTSPSHLQPHSALVQVLWEQQLGRLAAQRLHPVSGGRGPPGARQLLQDSGDTLRPAAPPLQHLQGGGECPSSDGGLAGVRKAISDRWVGAWAPKGLYRAPRTSSSYQESPRNHGVNPRAPQEACEQFQGWTPALSSLASLGLRWTQCHSSPASPFLAPAGPGLV